MAAKFQPPPDTTDAMSEESAKQLLEQTRQALLASNPALARNPQFQSEFDDSFNKFVNQGLQRGTSYEEAWANTVKPVIDKWQTVSQMPQTAKWQPNDVEKYKENLILSRESRMSAAKLDPTTDSGAQQKKTLAGIAENAQKVVSDIEAKYPTRQQFQPLTDIPELPQGQAPSDLGFGAKYRVGNRVFQNFSPTPMSAAPADARMQTGGSMQQPPPVAPGAPPDESSAPPMMPAPVPRFDPANIMPQPDQTPATAGMMNGAGMFSAPNVPTAPSPNIDPSTVLTGENLPVPAPAPKGIRVRNKKTGQMGTQFPDGTIVADAPQ